MVMELKEATMTSANTTILRPTVWYRISERLELRAEGMAIRYYAHRDDTGEQVSPGYMCPESAEHHAEQHAADNGYDCIPYRIF